MSQTPSTAIAVIGIDIGKNSRRLNWWAAKGQQQNSKRCRGPHRIVAARLLTSARPTTAEPISAHPECLKGESPSAGTAHEAGRIPYRTCREGAQFLSLIQVAPPLPGCANQRARMSRRDPILPWRTLAKPREATRHMQLQRPRAAVRTRVSSA